MPAPTPPVSDKRPPENAVRVPGDRLYVDALAGAPGETAEDTEARVRLAIEATAPLPLEKLVWGWTRAGDRVLYYAAARERLTGLAPPPDDPACPPLLPDFTGARLPPALTPASPDGRHADMRDRYLLRRLDRDAATARRLRHLHHAVAALALITGLAAMAAAALTLMHRRDAETLAGLAPAVAETEAKADLLAVLTRAAGAGTGPVEALAEVNARRPESVIFSRFEHRDGAELLITGRAATVDAVNRFADSLGAAGLFSAITLESLDTQDGRTGFRLRLRLRSAGRPAERKTA